MTIFKRGETYQMRFIGDSDLIVPVTIKNRTAKTIWFTIRNGKEVKRKKIYIHNEVEYFLPEGQYSMAPSCNAERIYIDPALEVLKVLDPNSKEHKEIDVKISKNRDTEYPMFITYIDEE